MTRYPSPGVARRFAPKMVAAGLLIVLFTLTGNGHAVDLQGVGVVASTSLGESRGKALIKCTPEGDCIAPGSPSTEPPLRVQRRSVVEVRSEASVVSVSVALARRTSDAFADDPRRTAVPTTDGAWAIQLPDDLQRAEALAVYVELESGFSGDAWIPLDVLPGVSTDEPLQFSGGGGASDVWPIGVAILMAGLLAGGAVWGGKAWRNSRSLDT